MNNTKIELDKKIFSERPSLAALRDGFGEGIVLAAEKNKNIVALCADLTDSTRLSAFKEKFPARFFELGVAEQNLAAVAAGFGLSGLVPFISSYAVFSPGRALEQIRTTICYNDVNVKIAGHHAGLSVGPDGATHQALEDIAITRSLPNMRVIVPCDAIEARKATFAASVIHGPVYIRLARALTPVITLEKTRFIPGSAYFLYESKIKKNPDVAIIGAGPVLYEALIAARALDKEKISVSVLNLHTIKPIDKAAILALAKSAKAIITIEEHQIMGGVGSAVAEFLAENYPVPIEFVGIRDSFGESGKPEELIKKYGLDSCAIIKSARKLLKRK